MDGICKQLSVRRRIIPGFLTHDNNLTTEWNLMKFWYVVQLIKLNNVSKFHQNSCIGLLNIMSQKSLVWSLRYDPTQHLETLIWRFLRHIALWWQESKLWNAFYFVLTEAGSYSSQHRQKKGYCILGDSSCTTRSMVILGLGSLKTHKIFTSSDHSHYFVLYTMTYNNSGKNRYAEPVHNKTMKIFKIRD